MRAQRLETRQSARLALLWENLGGDHATRTAPPECPLQQCNIKIQDRKSRSRAGREIGGRTAPRRCSPSMRAGASASPCSRARSAHVSVVSSQGSASLGLLPAGSARNDLARRTNLSADLCSRRSCQGRRPALRTAARSAASTGWPRTTYASFFGTVSIVPISPPPAAMALCGFFGERDEAPTMKT